MEVTQGSTSNATSAPCSSGNRSVMARNRRSHWAGVR